jgi:hypothetical protein
VKVGTDAIAYSDSAGNWSVQVKNTKTQTVQVVPDVFAIDGNWEIVSAPATAEPAKPIEIVVRRSQSVPIAPKPIAEAAVPAETPAKGHKSFLKRLWNAALGRE